jgi:hypothetical protein
MRSLLLEKSTVHRDDQPGFGGPLGRSIKVELDNSNNVDKGSVGDTKCGAVMAGMELRLSIAAAFMKHSFWRLW